MTSKQQKQCPECSSINVAQILYGFLAPDDELDRQLSEAKARLGGCESDSGNPTWYCNECGNEWGGRRDGPPRLTDDELITVILPTINS